MTDDMKKEEAAQTVEITEKQNEPGADPTGEIQKLSKGSLELATPIRAGGKDVTRLDYDFTKLTGWEYADAMDRDLNATNVFRVSNKQALSLFAAAAAKVTPGIDTEDISKRMGSQDTIKAVQLATIFFVASTRAGNKRILNA